MKNIILYGILGAEQQYRVARYWVIRDTEDIYELVSDGRQRPYVREIGKEGAINAIMYEANKMIEVYPFIEHVYVLDNSYRLKRDYLESIKKNSIESCYEFKDILEREGLKII